MARAIAFTGMPGSGKSVAVEVARRLGMPVFRMGDAVWAEVRARGLSLDEAHVGRVATEMREAHGPGIWAVRTAERIRKTDSPLVVIDGVRSLAEVEVFRRELGPAFTLVALHASSATRLGRLMGRGRQDDVKSEAEFRGRDERELSWGIGQAIAVADATLENEGEVAQLERDVETLLRRLAAP
ncbi:MAG TPA: AAA family ATPase [Candidatus Thermoplasmatota archaeon]|nr:AAA family ATPase [Candidatus Thermoplasmatota archaeon]